MRPICGGALKRVPRTAGLEVNQSGLAGLNALQASSIALAVAFTPKQCHMVALLLVARSLGQLSSDVRPPRQNITFSGRGILAALILDD